MGGSFKYQSLDLNLESRQIRFLQLLPAERFDDEIHCTIFHSSLKTPPVYEALSYVWGSKEDKLLISLRYGTEQIAGAAEMQDEENHELNRNQNCPLNFKLTQNLSAALRHIRLPNSSRIMWIDAICIDQSSIPGKNHQVSQMRNVYLLSERVLLWLGEEKDSAIAINFLCQMPLQENGYGSYNWNPDDELKWAACGDLFFKRPYWGRSWILQQVPHNRDVLFYIGL
jgi:hypothetical protein